MGDELQIWGLRRDLTNSANIKEFINSARESRMNNKNNNDFKDQKFLASLVADSFTQKNSPSRHEDTSCAGFFENDGIHNFNIQSESTDHLPGDILVNLECICHKHQHKDGHMGL